MMELDRYFEAVRIGHGRRTAKMNKGLNEDRERKKENERKNGRWKNDGRRVRKRRRRRRMGMGPRGVERWGCEGGSRVRQSKGEEGGSYS